MRRSYIPILAILAILAAALTPAGTTTAQTPGGVKGCSTTAQRPHGNFHAALHVRWDGHKPHHWVHAYNRDEKKFTWFAKWPIRVTASRNGRGISGGHVFYQFLNSGRVVACRTVLRPAVPRFRNGTFRDEIQFPERSVLIPLTFRVVVQTKYGLKNLDYKIVVQKRRS